MSYTSLISVQVFLGYSIRKYNNSKVNLTTRGWIYVVKGFCWGWSINYFCHLLSVKYFVQSNSKCFSSLAPVMFCHSCCPPPLMVLPQVKVNIFFEHFSNIPRATSHRQDSRNPELFKFHHFDFGYFWRFRGWNENTDIRYTFAYEK